MQFFFSHIFNLFQQKKNKKITWLLIISLYDFFHKNFLICCEIEWSVNRTHASEGRLRPLDHPMTHLVRPAEERSDALCGQSHLDMLCPDHGCPCCQIG